MQANDYDAFAQLLDDAYDLIGVGANKIISGGAKSMFFAAMAPYSLATVRAALAAHCIDKVRGRFTPKPADIIEQIESSALNDGRPGAEEAWAISLTSRDEADTVVWTAECAEAFAICKSVLATGDEVGARMAFKEAYTRIVAQSRFEHRPATWSASQGWDVIKRAAAVKRAVLAGLLPAPSVAGLLEGPAGDPTPEMDARAQLDAIRRMLAESAATSEAARLAEVELGHAATVEFKRQTNERVREYLVRGVA